LTVEDGETGILFDQPEPDQIAQAIERVVETKYFEAQARTVGRDTVSRYSWAEQAANYRDLLKQA